MDQSPGLIAILCAPIADAPYEIARVAYLDRAGRLLAIGEHRGRRDHLTLSIRTLVREALEHDAATVLLVHNHPSGDARPSADDIAFTRRLAATMAAIGVRLHDHLVVAGRHCASLCRESLL